MPVAVAPGVIWPALIMLPFTVPEPDSRPAFSTLMLLPAVRKILPLTDDVSMAPLMLSVPVLLTKILPPIVPLAVWLLPVWLMPVMVKVTAVFSKAMSLRVPLGVVPLLLAVKLVTVLVLLSVVPPTEVVLSTPPLIVPP